MIGDVLTASVEVISAFATAALLASIWTACRSYGVRYLIAIPVGFGLMAVSFMMGAIASLLGAESSASLSIGAVYLLVQTYGLMFLAFTYARRTRLRLIGESTTVELLMAGVVSTILFLMIFASTVWASASTPLMVPDLFLRVVMFACSLYLVYETSRNWEFTRKAADGFVTIGYGFLAVEQIGFMLAYAQVAVGLFLGYEGRLLGLFVLIAVAHIGIRKGDFATAMKRMGLVAPAH